MRLNNSVLVVEKNCYTTKIENVYIIYDLNNWPINPLNNFTLKNCLSGATNIAKNGDESKYVYSGYVITFDCTGSWCFGNGFARNVVILGVDNSSSSHTDNRKNNFSVFGKGPTGNINGSIDKILSRLILK